MTLRLAPAFVALALAVPAQAQELTGDPAKGEAAFRKCKACHTVESPDEVLIRGGKTGPNLWGVPGRMAGTVEDFRYSDAMVQAGQDGLVWNDADFHKYVQDPTGFLQEYLDDNAARGKMTFKLRDEQEASDIWAYLVSVSPEVAMDGGAQADTKDTEETNEESTAD